MKLLRKNVFNLLLVMVMLQGCIKEDLAECIYRLNFNFEQQGCEDGLPLPDDVHSISVFVFDHQGLFVEELSVQDPKQGSELLVDLPVGTYTLVAYAGFTPGQLSAANLVKGSSNIKELYIPSYTSTADGNAAPGRELYYGIVRDVVLDLPPAILTQELDMIQNTKPLNVKIRNMDLGGKYRLSISQNATDYQNDNTRRPPQSLDDRSREPMFVTIVPDTYSVNTHLLWPIDQTDPELVIEDMGTREIIFKASLKTLLEKLPEIDFNCQPYINIEINYRPGTQVEVSLNGWWIIYSTNEI